MLMVGSGLAEDIYISQTEQGADKSSSCANSHAASWFNTAGNWGGGAGEIDPGDTVYLCDDGGNFTTMLAFPASGSSGNIVTITVPETETVVMDGADTTECINWGAQNYIIVDGNSRLTLQNCDANEGYAVLMNGDYGIFSNSTIIHPVTRAITVGPAATFTTISGNYIDTLANDTANENDAVTFNAGGSGGSIDYVFDNIIWNRKTGGTYIDAIHAYGGYAGTIYIYRNFVRNDSATTTGSIDLQFASGNAGMTAYIFNNIFYNGPDTYNCTNVILNYPDTATAYFYNNTVITLSAGGGSGAIYIALAPNATTFRNNIFYSASDILMFNNTATPITPSLLDYNLWYRADEGNLAVVQVGNQRAWDWLIANEYEPHGVNDNPDFNSLGNLFFYLISGSPAINVGVDLGDTYTNGINPNSSWPDSINTLNQDDFGTGWEMGAYVYKFGAAGLLMASPNNFILMEY